MHRPTSGGARPMPARVGDSRRKRTSPWTIAGLTALGVLAVVALVVGIYVSQLPGKATVPDLANKSKDQAAQMLAQLNLSGQPTAIACDDKSKQNMVTSQSPDPGTKLTQGSAVNYQWCNGPGNVQIPPVVGEPLATAQQQLQALHLTVNVVQVDSDQPKDVVVSVNPTVGQTVTEGQSVTLNVSKADRKLIPDFNGKNYTASAYEAVLGVSGFTHYSVVYRDVSDPSQDGIVVATDPDAGQSRDPASTNVTIFIGQYNGPTNSPTASPSSTSTP
jgi:eukaryotic-like serine/threonine-protein kinase